MFVAHTNKHREDLITPDVLGVRVTAGHGRQKVWVRFGTAFCKLHGRIWHTAMMGEHTSGTMSFLYIIIVMIVLRKRSQIAVSSVPRTVTGMHNTVKGQWKKNHNLHLCSGIQNGENAAKVFLLQRVLRKHKLESSYCGQIKDVCQSVTYIHMSGTRHKKTGYRRKCLNLAGKPTWNVIPLPQLTDLFVVSKKGTNISLFLNSRWY